MEEQLLRAVEIASSGAQSGHSPDIVQQALVFLEQAKQNTQEVWLPGWRIFAERRKEENRPLHSHQQRLFGLSLVTLFLESSIQSIADPQQAVAHLQSEALKHFDAEYIGGTGEDGAAFLTNKFAQFLSSLLVQTYALPPPFTLLPDLVARMRIHNASSSSALNPLATDMVLRLLHEVSVTLGSDVTLRAVRSNDRIARDTAIRDEIRATQASGIAEAVWKAIEESFAKVQELATSQSSSVAAFNAFDSQGWNLARATDITCQGAKVIGDYVSWIDIGLVVTPHTVGLLYGLLQQNIARIRSAAIDALVEIISKGMKSADKFTLLRILNLTETVSELEKKSRKSIDQQDLDDEEVTYREHLAKLANGVAIELVKIVEDGTADLTLRTQSDELLLAHMNLILDFLKDEYDELAEAVMSSVNAILTIYKKLKRQNGASGIVNGQQTALSILSSEKAAFMSKLMGILLIKMKFADESEWTGSHDVDEGEDDDDADQVAHFLNLRKHLQQQAAAISSIDESLFSTPTTSLIFETLDAYDASLRNAGPAVSWQRAELALYLIFFCGEVLAGGQGQVKAGLNAVSFVILPDNTPKATRNKPPEGFLLSLTLNPLGEMAKRFFHSDISTFRHPAVQMQYFDCAVRFSAFFSVQPQMLGDALAPFLDWRGIHNERSAVRSRTNYLFLRFLKETREHIQPTFVQTILESMQDLLVVRASLPSVGPGEDPLEEAIKRSTALDGQLDLFEACGVLLRLVRSTPEMQTMLLKALIDPLTVQLQAAVQSRLSNYDDLHAVLLIHHLFFALANLAKGFPDISPANGAQTADWMNLFKGVIEEMLTTLDTANLSDFKVIRDAARGAFSRMVATTGFTVLPYVPALLRALLPRISAGELLDFLSFLGLIMAKYKSGVAAAVDEMLGSLLERTFYFLNQDVSGTDDALQRDQLVKGYITFLSTLIGANLDDVLRSSRNQPNLEATLQSLVYYASNSQPATLRAIGNILTRLISLWLEPSAQVLSGSPSASKANGVGNPLTTPSTPLPGFEQFAYKTLVGLTFEIPAKATFDFDDAQSQIALTELCNLLKAVYAKRGGEFVEFLLTVYFPSINCPAALAQEFVEALQKQEVKVFKKSLETFIRRSRGIITT